LLLFPAWNINFIVIKSERQNQNVTIPHLCGHATFQPGQTENTEQGHMTLLTLAAP